MDTIHARSLLLQLRGDLGTFAYRRIGQMTFDPSMAHSPSATVGSEREVVTRTGDWAEVEELASVISLALRSHRRV